MIYGSQGSGVFRECPFLGSGTKIVNGLLSVCLRAGEASEPARSRQQPARRGQ